MGRGEEASFKCLFLAGEHSGAVVGKGRTLHWAGRENCLPCADRVCDHHSLPRMGSGELN